MPVVLLALAAACLVILFFGWNVLCLPVGRYGTGSVCGAAIGIVSGWAGFGVAAGVAAICLVLWEGLALAGALVLDRQATEHAVAAALATALALFALLRVVTRLTGLTAFGWLGLALAVAAAAVAVARWLRDRNEPGVSHGEYVA